VAEKLYKIDPPGNKAGKELANIKENLEPLVCSATVWKKESSNASKDYTKDNLALRMQASTEGSV
jgi:hypothetical protein